MLSAVIWISVKGKHDIYSCYWFRIHTECLDSLPSVSTHSRFCFGRGVTAWQTTQTPRHRHNGLDGQGDTFLANWTPCASYGARSLGLVHCRGPREDHSLAGSVCPLCLWFSLAHLAFRVLNPLPLLVYFACSSSSDPLCSVHFPHSSPVPCLLLFSLWVILALLSTISPSTPPGPAWNQSSGAKCQAASRPRKNSCWTLTRASVKPNHCPSPKAGFSSALYLGSITVHDMNFRVCLELRKSGATFCNSWLSSFPVFCLPG